MKSDVKMQNKWPFSQNLRWLQLGFFLFMQLFSYAQAQDTIYVIEYEYVTDTLWVETDKFNRDTAYFSTYDAKPIEILTSKTATFPEKLINRVQTNTKPEMKKIAFLGMTILLFNSSAFCQHQWRENLSFFIKGNLATQLHRYTDEALTNAYQQEVTSVQFGQHVEHPLPTFGFGASTHFQVNDYLSFYPRISYNQKGCFNGSNSESNRFNYLSSDLLLRMEFGRSKKAQPFFYTGFKGDYLLWANIDYDINILNHYNNGYGSFSNFSIGLINGLGCTFKDTWHVELEVNNDLTPIIDNAYLSVKNLVYSMNLGIYLNRIPKVKIVL